MTRLALSGFFTQEALPGLHDIVVPEPVSWAPATVAWPLAGLVVLVLAGLWLRRIHLGRAANRYRAEALKELAAIEASLAQAAAETSERSGATQTRALAGLPVLVKRVALSFADRGQVASLTGEPWLAFLDRSYGGTGFTQGPGRTLTTLAYASPETGYPRGEAAELVALVRDWVRNHDARRVSEEQRNA